MDVFGSAPQRVMSVVARYQTYIALNDQDVIFKVAHNCLRDHQCISGPNGSFIIISEVNVICVHFKYPRYFANASAA